MAMQYAVKTGDKLIIHHKDIGYARATAAEDKDIVGNSAFDVFVNSKLLPGISYMRINVNFWDVWKDDDIEVLKRIATQALVRDFVR